MADIEVLNVGRDNQAAVAYLPPFTRQSYTANLAATTNTTLTVPDGAKFAIFSFQAGASVFVSSATITAPGSSFAQTADQSLNPSGKQVSNVTTLNFFAGSQAWVNVEFFG